MHKFGRFLATAAMSVGGAFFALPAAAVPQIEISHGASTVVIADQGAGDINDLVGAVVFAGTVGDFFINVTTGVTKPVLGSAEVPRLDLNSINVSGPTGAVLTIRFTETDFSSPSGYADIFSAIGGTTAGSVQYLTYASLTNDAFAEDILISDSGILSGPFVFSDMSTVAISGTYSLTTVAIITHSGSGNQNSSFNAVVELPEPFLAPPIILGTLLLSATMIARRRRKRL